MQKIEERVQKVFRKEKLSTYKPFLELTRGGSLSGRMMTILGWSLLTFLLLDRVVVAECELHRTQALCNLSTTLCQLSVAMMN